MARFLKGVEGNFEVTAYKEKHCTGLIISGIRLYGAWSLPKLHSATKNKPYSTNTGLISHN